MNNFTKVQRQKIYLVRPYLYAMVMDHTDPSRQFLIECIETDLWVDVSGLMVMRAIMQLGAN